MEKAQRKFGWACKSKKRLKQGTAVNYFIENAEIRYGWEHIR